MKLRIAVATGIAGLLFAGYLSLSGAPARVHVATATGLFAAFWLPALLVAGPGDLWTRRWLLLGLVALGVVVLDVGMTMTISKKEFLDAPALFAVGVPAMIGLLAVHGLVVRRLNPAGAV